VKSFNHPLSNEIDFNEAFDLLDRKKSGFITAEDLSYSMNLLGYYKVAEDGDDLVVNMLKEDEDHQLSREEFVHLFSSSSSSICNITIPA